MAENKDIIIEINTSLFIGGRRIVNKIVDDFLSEIQRLSLAHYHRNIKVTGSRGFFLFSLPETRKKRAMKYWYMSPIRYGRTMSYTTCFPI